MAIRIAWKVRVAGSTFPLRERGTTERTTRASCPVLSMGRTERSSTMARDLPAEHRSQLLPSVVEIRKMGTLGDDSEREVLAPGPVPLHGTATEYIERRVPADPLDLEHPIYRMGEASWRRRSRLTVDHDP